ncbi:hypothetical protein LCGC14_2314790 [marine sediment metagenome]|uniref:Uncharacterized protein n=1 Tax=marine sediment metagenome TaxID=412755 RepID=A0A0F9FEF2_9ZZZZ
MSTIPSGISAQLGIAIESTYGTYAAPTKFVVFNNESIVQTIERIESPGIGRTTNVMSVDHWTPGQQENKGTIEIDVLTKGFNIIWEQMFGASVTTQPGGATATYDTTHTITDLMGTSGTWQIGRPDSSSTVQPFSYVGTKVTEWELSQAVNEFLKLTVTLDAKEEKTDQALGASSYASGAKPLPFTGSTITIDGNSYILRSVSIKGVNGAEEDRFQLGAATKLEIIQEAHREITAEFELEFSSLVAYNLFRNAVSGSEVEVVIRFQAGTAIESSLFPFVRVTLPACRFDRGGPSVGGPERLIHTLTCKALNDGTNEPITLVYRSTDSDTYPSDSSSLSPSVSPSLSASTSESLSISVSPSLSPSASASLSPSPSA